MRFRIMHEAFGMLLRYLESLFRRMLPRQWDLYIGNFVMHLCSLAVLGEMVA